MKTRTDEMREQCSAFHEKNPMVWQYFVRFTRIMIDKALSIIQSMRSLSAFAGEIDAGGDGISTFKLNNNYRAFAACRFGCRTRWILPHEKPG